MRHTRIALAAVLALALAGAGCGASEGGGGSGGNTAQEGEGGKPAKLRIAYQVIPNGAPIVKHYGWLEKELGIPIEWQQFDSGADVNRAVAASSVDIGLAGSSPVANGIASGLPYKVAWIYDIIGDAEQLAVRKDSGVSDLAGLKGKKVGVPFGSTSHYALLTALSKAGVSPNDVDILDMAPEDIVAAWQRGDIAGAYVWHPSLGKLKEDGGKVLVSSAQLAEQGTLTGDLGIVSNEFAEKYPAAVNTWLQQEQRAIRLAKEEPQKAAAAVGAEFDISPKVARGLMKDLILLDAGEQASPEYLGTPGKPGKLATQLEETATFLKEQKIITQAPSLEDFRTAVDPEFAAKVAGS